jgi:anti-sigma factor RsiW
VNRESHPTRDELLVMAYVDDELAEDQRQLLQERLAKEPELAQQVAVYQKLAILANQMAPPEPHDLEWNRLKSDPVHQGTVGLGWILLAGGLIALFALLMALVIDSELSSLIKVLLIAPISGFLLLTLVRLRDRIKLAPFDPYTEVKR